MTEALLGAGLLVAVLAGARGTWSPCGLSMVSAINPMSERARGNRYWLTTLWFIAGSLLGGALLGAGAGALAWVLRPMTSHPTAAGLIGAIAALVVLAADRRVAGFHLPLYPRQVNELWLMQYRRWLYAAGFGVQIGCGFSTYIMTAANYLLVVLAVLTGSPAQAWLVCLTFGLVRGLAVLLSARCRSAARLRDLHLRLSRFEPLSLAVVVAAEGAVAGGLGYATAGPRGGVACLVLAIVVTIAGNLPIPPGRAAAEVNEHRTAIG